MRPSRQCLSGLVWAVLWVVLGAGLAASCVEPPPGSTAEQEALDVCALANDGDLCDDHQACTYPDVCMNKKCVGMAVLDGTRCTDGNACTINDHCAAGVCVATVQPDGTSCTDGDPCTDPDVCQQGVCQPGGPLVCDDANDCTIDSCQAGVGCVFSPRDCALPPDAGPGPDAMMTPDAPRVDSGGGDAVVDLGGGDGAPADMQSVDAPPRIDTGVDTTPADAAPPDADAGIDAAGGGGADSGTDAGNGVVDAGDDLVETPPDLRARGGGCACAVGTGGSDAAGTFLLVFAVVVARARRRRQHT